MEMTEAQYEWIRDVLPVQRGSLNLSNLEVLNAVLYVTEQGCQRRDLPLAHDLSLDDPQVQERRAGSRLREAAERADRSGPA